MNKIAENKAWTLWHTKKWDRHGWHSFNLRNSDQTRKYSYYGGWNGDSLAQSSDMKRLREKEPEVYSWLEQICRFLWPNEQSA